MQADGRGDEGPFRAMNRPFAFFAELPDPVDAKTPGKVIGP